MNATDLLIDYNQSVKRFTIFTKLGDKMNISVMDAAAVAELLPVRKAESHKGDYGRLLLLCGSEGYTGAAALAAMGALRTGAGLVYLGVPRCIYTIEAVKLTEAVVFPLPDRNGMLASEAIGCLEKKLRNMDAVLIGPGLGQSPDVLQVVMFVLQHFQGAVVLDADGINVLAAHKDILRGRQAPTVLTPHPGEFRRLYPDAGADRIAAAVHAAEDLGVTVVLKGHETVITDGVRTYINHTGNPGMAVGGSGDVLAGILTALLGFGLPATEAAACAAWLHGRAGDLCAEKIGQYGMLPTDMLKVLPRLLK